MNKTKLNPGLIASYDLRPGNAVVSILVEWKGMDERREKMRKLMDNGGKRQERVPRPNAEYTVSKAIITCIK